MTLRTSDASEEGLIDPMAIAERPVPWRAIFLLLVLGVLFGVGWMWREELAPRLAVFQSVIEGLGPWGPAAYIVLFVGWALLGLPISVMSVLGGVIFGGQPIVALVSVSVGSTLGAAACFLVTRHVARESVRRWLGRSRRFARIDAATARHGVWVVALTRLIPIFPKNVVNYSFGLTRIGFWKYVAVTWVCLLPSTVFYVFVAVGMFETLRHGVVPWDIFFTVLGVLAVVVAAGLYARRVVRRMRLANGNGDGDGEEGGI